MATGKVLLTGEALIKRAQELGVNARTGETYNVSGQGTQFHLAPEHEIQRRVLDAERHIREHRLWLIALISAIASAVSAAVALVAVWAQP